MFRFSLCLTLLLVSLCAARAADVPSDLPDHTAKAWHVKLVELHNAARAAESASPLMANVLLAKAAQAHANHMAKTGKFAHEGIDNGTPTTRIAEAGYQGMRWGENIAWGADTPEKVQEIWMNSPPHKAQLLKPEYTQVGFGVCKAPDGKIYWVACFGTPLP